MRNKLYKIAQLASLLLATAFTFSCWLDGNVGGGSCDWLEDCSETPEEKREREESERQAKEWRDSVLNSIAPCVDGTVKIGDQVWQKCNLNVKPSTGKSSCYNNDNANCQKFGRLYNWATAMALPDSCNKTNCDSQVAEKHRGLCPSGWHIPSNTDKYNLVQTVGRETGGKYLKTSVFGGLDSYGFSALLGGYGTSGTAHKKSILS